MAVCHFCGQEMLANVSCSEGEVFFPDGTKRAQIRYGEEAYPWSDDPCHDCGTPTGGFHHPGCDVSECPRCRGQLISCGCLDDPDDLEGDVVGFPHVPATTRRILFGETEEDEEELLGPEEAPGESEEAESVDGGLEIDDVLAGVRANIDEVGWSTIAIGGGPCACCGETSHEGPDFLYTIGLTETFAAPELIVFGLPARIAHGVVAIAVEYLRTGARFAANTFSPELANLPVAFIAVPKDEFAGRLNCAAAFYGDEFTVLQLVWPDSAGRFPWDDGYEQRFLSAQPLLGSWMPVRVDAS